MKQDRWQNSAVSTKKFVSALSVLCLGAAFTLRAQNAAQGAHNDAGDPPPHHVKANYELASRFMPDRIKKLVFSTAVQPHWFETSDRFWYSYETPEVTHYYIVDPAKKSKSPLWDNAKVAAQLSLLTNFPYNAQHLPVTKMHLVDKDAKLAFEFDVRKDAVIPGEPKKETKQEETQQGKEGEGKKDGEPSPDTRALHFKYDLSTGKVTRIDNWEDLPKPMPWASVSPDEKTIIFGRGYNLYMMDAENYAKAQKNIADTSVVETQLTTDGAEKYSYTQMLRNEQAEKLKKLDKGDTNAAGIRTPPVSISWSKDSKKFALVRNDNRKVSDLWVIHNLANPRPTLETYPYAMPGEDHATQYELHILDVASKQNTVVPAKNFVDQTITIASAPLSARQREEQQEQMERLQGDAAGFLISTNRWLSDTSDKLYFIAHNRGERSWDVCVADTSTGTPRTLIQERSNIWLTTQPLRIVENGKELIWWSYRDGWAHYYLFDADGKLKNAITSGEYMAHGIVSVNDKTRTLYFTGNGREPGEDPYYTHLYRVNLDGSGLKMMTPSNSTHDIDASDDGKYFVDNFSRVDTAPKSLLFDDQGGSVADLETTDVSQLLEAGFRYPETFKVKADDGVTDLYGVMYKPFDFDPSRKYPIIEFVYPGPQTESVEKGFKPNSANVPLAQLGFIVIEVGNRGGSPYRDKWYDSYGYGNLRDYGLADKKAAAEHLAEIHPFIDISRVGIWGHSGGGFMSTAALLQYPDFFKAACSQSGNHENNVYQNMWSERYHGLREETQKDGTEKFFYDIDKNSELAKNLKGHLMLMTGDEDSNVHMANTMRLANALIKANKRFEMLVLPGMNHGYMPIDSWVIMRRGDFFAHWLLGDYETGADIIELQRERLATPSKIFKE
jgi:dipeptidyl aminopeptidase/acylaminoacyl peptidase